MFAKKSAVCPTFAPAAQPPLHILVKKTRPHPARVPLWLSIFLVPIAALNAHLPTEAAGGLSVAWIVVALVVLARLPHD